MYLTQEPFCVRLLFGERDPRPERARPPPRQEPLQVRPHARPLGAAEGGGARQARLAQGLLPDSGHDEPVAPPGV